MFTKLVVPLDGSALSATIVPHAACMARMMNAQVVLLRVGVLPRGRSAAKFRTIHADLRVAVPDSERDIEKEHFPIYRDQEIASYESDLLDSLAGTEEYFRRAQVAVRSVVRMGKPVEQILKIAEEEQAGAIMLSTHGDRGLGPWTLGDTTRRIVRLAHIPVITVHPTSPKPPGFDMPMG